MIIKYKNLPLIEDPYLKNKIIEDKTVIFLIIPKTDQEIMLS